MLEAADPLATDPVLQMRDISKRFGATRALDGVSLDVRAGQVLALIGENGAGKSTLMKILSGAIQPDRGSMRLAGRDYAPRGPHEARSRGVAMIYQELNLAPDLNAEDNIMLGQERHRLGVVSWSAQRDRVRQALERLGHANLPLDVPVRRLSVAMQQLVEIARALVFDAKLIVFDEPTSSLAAHDVRRLFEVIRNLKASGLGIVYISHFLEEIRQIADHYTVLRDGKVTGSGALAGAQERQIIELMIGRDVQELFPKVPHTPGNSVFTVKDLTGRVMPRGVSFDLRRGEILGIAGLIGAGRTELLRCLFALDPVRAGHMRISEARLAASPAARIRAGVGYLSEDRKGEGLAQNLSIADNMTCSRLRPYSRWGWLNMRRRRDQVTRWMQRLQVKAASSQQPVSGLSGGNQQKVAFARILHQDADVLLLDEPTRGIDIGTKAEIYKLMGELAAAGKSVIFVSSYLPELLAICDRIGVMARGRLREIRPTTSWTEHDLLASALSTEAAT